MKAPLGGPSLVPPRAPVAQPAPAGGSSGAASGAGKPVVGPNGAPVIDRATGLALPRVDAASLDPKGVEHAVWHLSRLFREVYSNNPKSEPFGIPLQEFQRFESLSARAASGEASPREMQFVSDFQRRLLDIVAPDAGTSSPQKPSAQKPAPQKPSVPGTPAQTFGPANDAGVSRLRDQVAQSARERSAALTAAAAANSLPTLPGVDAKFGDYAWDQVGDVVSRHNQRTDRNPHDIAVRIPVDDPPPFNWSILKYVFWQSGGPNAEETPQARRDRRQAAPG